MVKGEGAGEGLEAYLEYADGVKLDEHGSNGIASTGRQCQRITVWVESVTGKDFHIVVRRDGKTYKDWDVDITAWADTRRIADRALRLEKQETRIEDMVCRSGGRKVAAKLRFGQMTTVEDAANASLSDAQVGDLSCIVVRVSFGWHTLRGSERRNDPIANGDVGSVYEKKAKLGSLIRPGNMDDRDLPSVQTFTFERMVDLPEYEFHFKYGERPRLEALNIIPRVRRVEASRSSSESIEVIDSDEESDDDSDGNASQLEQHLKQESARINAQLDELSRKRKAKTETVVKQEVGVTRAQKRRSIGAGEVIDLTNPDSED